MSSNVKRISDWVTLSEGQNYYVEGSGIEGTSNDHLSVAVEIEQTAVTGHYHAMKEVQEIGISVTQQFEKMKVIVINPDSGKFILNFQNPVSLAYN